MRCFAAQGERVHSHALVVPGGLRPCVDLTEAVLARLNAKSGVDAALTATAAFARSHYRHEYHGILADEVLSGLKVKA